MILASICTDSETVMNHIIQFMKALTQQQLQNTSMPPPSSLIIARVLQNWFILFKAWMKELLKGEKPELSNNDFKMHFSMSLFSFCGSRSFTEVLFWYSAPAYQLISWHHHHLYTVSYRIISMVQQQIDGQDGRWTRGISVRAWENIALSNCNIVNKKGCASFPL